MQPQKNEVTQDEAKPQVVVLTEKAICVQGTDRVGTTSQGYLELSAAGKGGKAFPGTMRDGTCRLYVLKALSLFTTQLQPVLHTVTWT